MSYESWVGWVGVSRVWMGGSGWTVASSWWVGMILGDRELAPTTLKSLRFKPPLSPNYTFPNREPNESGWVVAEYGWFGVNRSKFVVSRDDSWWFLADRELAPKTLKSFAGPNQAWFGMSRDKPGARSGWFVALSGKSALSRDSLGPLGRNMHADDSGVSRGRVVVESGRRRRYS